MSYQVLSEHVHAFKKWASLKAYVILNALEIVFWAAVAFLMIQANSQFCVGLSCTLSWIVIVLAIILRYEFWHIFYTHHSLFTMHWAQV